LTAPDRRQTAGYVEALLAASLWGTSGIFASRLFAMGVSPESVAVLRPVAGLLFLLLAALLWDPGKLRVPVSGFLLMTGLGGAATGLFQLAFQLSLSRAGVPVTVALLYLSPAIVLAAAGPLLGEWPTRPRVGFALLSVVGVWLMALNAQGAAESVAFSSLMWGLLAAIGYAAYALLGRYAAPRWGSLATVVYSTLGAVVLLLIALPAAGASVELPTTAAAWTLLTLFGLLTISVATFLFYGALERIEAGPTAVACTVEPVVAALLASLLLGQGLEAAGWLGLVLVVVGVAGSYGSVDSHSDGARAR
jgi:drug/metabolite transporter (DMT)-like permease